MNKEPSARAAFFCVGVITIGEQAFYSSSCIVSTKPFAQKIFFNLNLFFPDLQNSAVN